MAKRETLALLHSLVIDLELHPPKILTGRAGNNWRISRRGTG